MFENINLEKNFSRGEDENVSSKIATFLLFRLISELCTQNEKHFSIQTIYAEWKLYLNKKRLRGKKSRILNIWTFISHNKTQKSYIGVVGVRSASVCWWIVNVNIVQTLSSDSYNISQTQRVHKANGSKRNDIETSLKKFQKCLYE